MKESALARKVLVTGGLGFVGAFLAKKLADSGYNVRVFDDESRGGLEKVRGYENRLEIVNGDIRDRDEVARAVEGCDTVYHLAAVNGTRNFYEHPEKVLDVNVKGVINTLETSIEGGVKKFVFASSSEVYQNPEHIPTDETERILLPDITNPRYSYGGSKIIGELFCLNYARKFDIQTVIVRFHNVYGPHMGYEHVIPELFMKIREATRNFDDKQAIIELQGKGDETRAFCYVDDTVAGTILAAEKINGNEIVHVGNDRETSIKDLVQAMAKTLNVKLEIRQGPMPQGSAPRRCPNIHKLRALGYEPQISLEEGLKRTLQWYKQNSKIPVR